MNVKFCTALMLAVLLLFSAACSTQTVDARLDAVEDNVEQRLDIVEDALERSIQITSAPVPKADAPVNTDAGGDAVLLTQEQAQAIALGHAGFTAADVTGLYTKYEIDDGRPEYEVQFRQDRWEYEYEIHAETGAILSFDMDD